MNEAVEVETVAAAATAKNETTKHTASGTQASFIHTYNRPNERPTIYTQNKSSFLLCTAEAEVHTPPQASKRAKKKRLEKKNSRKKHKGTDQLER